MKFSKKTIIFGAIGLIFIIGIASGVSIFFYQKRNHLTLTFVYRASILLEHNFKRIYIDPYVLPYSYKEKPADAIFITHSHEDHLSTWDIDKIYTSSTTVFCPSSCELFLLDYDPICVEPMENGTFGKIHYQTIPMYDNNAIHSKEQNWVGYILDFDGFTIFHTGDSDFIPEYIQLEGKIDVLLLPIYDSYYMMGPSEVNQTINVIKPRYVIPIHYLNNELEDFKTNYAPFLPDTQFLYLSEGESYLFTLSQERI